MKKIEYQGIQKHGNCYIWESLEDVDITCPECMTSGWGCPNPKDQFKVHLNMGNIFTLICRHCGCVFTIKVIEEEDKTL